MKKLLILLVIGVSLGGTVAFGQEYRRGMDYGHVSSERGRLGSDIERLNQKLNRIRWRMRRNGANWRLRREVSRLADQVNRIHWRYHHGSYDRHYLYREVERLRAELDNIEARLGGRSQEYYR